MSFHPSELHVIAVISNPVRYQSRYNLYKKFEKHMLESGVTLWTVEAAFGDRPYEVTTANNPQHIQLRSNQEVWQKEAMINIGISRLPPEAKYIAWIDADIEFVRKDWASETIEQLQHFQVVQMWHTALDLCPKYGVIQTHQGFMYSYTQGIPIGQGKYYNKYYHPGFAWAAKRGAIAEMAGRGLIDKAIVGSADHLMANCLIGRGIHSLPSKDVHPNYKKMVLDWEEMAEMFIKRNVGYVPGTIVHYFHGKKKDRRYIERSHLLVKNQFDPEKDVKYDTQGLLKLTDRGDARSNQLRDDLKLYFRQRNEDSIDL